MSLDIRDIFFPSPARMRQMSDTKAIIISTTMCTVMAAVALALSNAGDYYSSERDLATLTAPQVADTTREYIQLYENDLGIGGKIMNYGLYRSAKNHTDSK